MKILFIFPREKHYDSKTVREQPCGGTEKATIFLGEAFQRLGHKVEWITTIEQTRQPVATPDVVITQEAIWLEHFPTAKKVWLCHHFSDQPIIQRNAAYGRCFADAVITLSACQQRDFKNSLRIESLVIGHGLWLDEINRSGIKDPYRLIYASTPFRGLERIPELFGRIKEAEPRASIAIASSMGTYGTPEKDKEYEQLFDELRSIDGVELFGSLNQKQLYKEFARASIFFYPCIWPETYCMAMDEAIAHDCRLYVPDIGALPERLERDVKLPFWNIQYERVMAPVFKGRQPKDWLDVAKQWEAEVLHA